MALGLFQYSNVENKCGNVLDYVLFSEPCALDVSSSPSTLTAAAEKSESDERFHYPIEWEMIFANKKVNNSTSSLSPIRSFKRADFEQINQLWTNFDVNLIHMANTIDDAEKYFYDNMTKCIDQHVPLITPKNFGSNHPPWFDRELINLKNKRDKARKRIKERHNTRDYDAINEEFTRYHDRRVTEYQSEQNRLCKTNPKKFWDFVNSHRHSKGYPERIEYDGKESSNEFEAAQMFNEFFATVFTDEDSNFSIGDFLQDRNIVDEAIEEITTEEVLHELQSIDVTKGVGLDGIHPLLLKNCATSLANVICALLNKSIELGEVPTIWKKMKIIPIHKSGNRNLVRHYRPIAIPPNLAKIMDKIMTKRLNAKLESKISIHQHGFVKKRNTSTNLLELTQCVYDSFECNAQLDIFFADFSKAFDKVHHSKLITKLAELGVGKRMLKWQWAFLTGRTQVTKVGKGLSSEVPITSGIIQGGHQSPICFAAFINDLPQKIKEAMVSNFADDTKAYVQVNDIGDCEKLQQAINDFSSWCIDNKLDANVSKCHVMTFARKSKPIIFKYEMNGLELSRVHEHKDLGILLDTKLTMIPHMDKQTNKAKGMLALIRRMSNGIFTHDTTRTLYMSLVRSHLDYANVVYTPNHDVHINKIESIQKQFLLYALRDEQRDEDYRLRPYSERCTNMNLQSLARRRINTGILFIYDLIERNIVAPTLNDRIELRQSNNHNLRHRDFINIPLVTRSYLFNNPFLTMCRNFNKISEIYLSSMNRIDFKQKIEKLSNDFFKL